MIVRGERVFPVGYEGRRIICAGGRSRRSSSPPPTACPTRARRWPAGSRSASRSRSCWLATGWLTTGRATPHPAHGRTSGTAALSAALVVGACGSPSSAPAAPEHPQRVARRSAGGRATAPSCGRPRTARTAAPRSPGPSAAAERGQARRRGAASATYQPCAIGPCSRSSERTISGPSARAVPRATFSAALPPGVQHRVAPDRVVAEHQVVRGEALAQPRRGAVERVSRRGRVDAAVAVVGAGGGRARGRPPGSAIDQRGADRDRRGRARRAARARPRRSARQTSSAGSASIT